MTMIVAKNTVVTLASNVTNSDNDIVDEGDEPLSYLHGDYDSIFAKVEAALDGKPVGHTAHVLLEPDDAFGEYDVELLTVVDLALLPANIQENMMVERVDEETQEAVPMVVTNIADGKAVLDANHPLAGVRLNFTCTITAIRPASPDEITAGQADSRSIPVTGGIGHA